MKSAVTLTVLACGFWIVFPGSATADEYRVETISEPAPTEDVDAAIHGKLSKTGLRVIKGESRTICELWLVDSPPVIAGFEGTPVRLYPFEAGDLIGVVHLPRRGSDFRDQDLSSGVYTLRYGLQPIDGNHVGTSPTRDFLLLVSASEDSNPDRMDEDRLVELSAAAAGSQHPAMWCLQKMDDDASPATIREVPGRDWWALRLEVAGGSSADSGKVPMDLVVVGVAAE